MYLSFLKIKTAFNVVRPTMDFHLCVWLRGGWDWGYASQSSPGKECAGLRCHSFPICGWEFGWPGVQDQSLPRPWTQIHAKTPFLPSSHNPPPLWRRVVGICWTWTVQLPLPAIRSLISHNLFGPSHVGYHLKFITIIIQYIKKINPLSPILILSLIHSY